MTFPVVQPVIHVEPVSIHWYGLLVVVGIATGYLICRMLVSRVSYLVSRKEFDNIFYSIIIWGFIGARLYHIFNEPYYYWNNPLDIVKVWNGGLAIHGAIIAGFVVICLFVRKRNIHFFNISDPLVTGLALGQTIGRWGNYFNQELFGKPTTSYFNVFIDHVHRPAGFETIAYYHPTFFYESVLNLILFIVLLWGYRRYRGNRIGLITSWYLIGYGLIRFFVDFLRIDPRPFLGGLFLSQWVSILMIVIGIVVWYTFRKSKV